MTTTDKATLAAQARQLADNLTRWDATSLEVIALLRTEADRLDPPARKTVTWEGSTYHLDAEGVTSSDVIYWTRGFIDAVVLPLLADAPDGPIPDETVERACRVKVVTLGSRWEDEPPWAREASLRGMRAALEAVRGLPGMAVVRAGKPPEVLRWEVWDKDGERIVRCGTRETAREFIRQYHEDDVVRVVAVIADPGEGTV